MRIRSIKPEFWRSSDVSKHSIEDRLLFIGLWSYVDDNGVGRDSDAAITADLFADDLERDPRETFARVHRGLAHLFEGGQIVRYDDDEGRRLLCIVNWGHQKIDRPSKARYPLPTSSIEPLATDSRDPREDASEDSLRARLGAGEQGSRGTEEQTPPSGESALASAPPSRRGTRLPTGWEPPPAVLEEMRQECPNVPLHAEHRKFVDYWTAKTGRDATKLDWQATWRNWIRRANETAPTTHRNSNGFDVDAAMARAQAREHQKGIPA